MIHNNKEVLEYWNDDKAVSMYDKNIVAAEIRLIKTWLKENTMILDAGCGEGEGTKEYAKIKGVTIHAADFSVTRLSKARARLQGLENVQLFDVDFVGKYVLGSDYDFIISQRFLINLMEWELQQKIILDLMGLLKNGGKFLMLEGSCNGVDELNKFRNVFNLPPIPVKWHNLFFRDAELIDFMGKHNYKLIETNGLGEYFLFTRGVRPAIDKNLDWDTEYNRLANNEELQEIFNFREKFSRLKLWVFEK